MPKAASAGHVRCIAKVSGVIVRAKGLLNTKLLGKSVPRCLVKGIKGNSHLIDFFCTDLGTGHDPQWDQKWSYDTLKTRSQEDFVGLKFIVYDGEEFLGGADIDISELPEYRDIEEELELTGIFFTGKKGQAPKKARLFVTISVERRVVPLLARPRILLLDSMRSVTRTTAICGRIVRARGVRGKSAPMCFIRCYMLSGKVIDLYNTKCESAEVVDPHWNETFGFDFDDDADQPLMVMFNIFGSAELSTTTAAGIFKADDHLGSAMVPVDSIKDETSFQNGEGRVKLRLLDQCQQIEKCLDRDAGRAAREAKKAEELANPKKSSWADRFENAQKKLSDFRGAKNFGGDKCYITLELFAERQDAPMPHHDLMNESMIVEEADLELTPDDELKKYFDDGKLEGGETVKRLEITSEERIFTVYGRVNSAMDLIAADITGKSDPYVIVEALTKTGQMLFVYRTRYIKANLNPVWLEGFVWKVPADPDNPTIPVALSKLVFSIFDTDEFQLLETGDDDFLGHCNVDVSFMRNQDYICEDIPLLGVKARNGKVKAGGFRRYSTLSCEVRVERRVVRIVSAKHEFDPALLDCPRHHESRPMLPPDVPVYRDHSQEVALNDPSTLDHTAARILSLRESNSLLELAKQHNAMFKQHDDAGWLHSRELESRNLHLEPPLHAGGKDVPNPPTSELQGLNEVQPYRRNWKALNESWHQKMAHAQEHMRNVDYVNRLPPMRRTASLPLMATRFGERYRQLTNTMNPFEEDVFSSGKLITQNFTSHTQLLDTVQASMRTKPNFDNYTMRREVSTAPARTRSRK